MQHRTMAIRSIQLSHLEVRLLEDPGQFGCTVIFHHEVFDVAQNLRHQLHVVVLHCFQLHFLLLLVSLEETKQLREGRFEGVKTE